MGEMYVFERPHLSFWFGCGIRATPLGSNFDGEEATERRNLRVRGLPLLRRVQMSATTFNWIIAFIADKACGVVPVAA
jgi:hypothetical protein